MTDAVSKNPLEWAEQAGVYFSEVKIEFKKVTWPTQKETVAGTVGTVFVVAIVSVTLFFVDWGLGWVFNAVLP